MQTSARSIPTRVVPGASALHRVAPQAPIAGQAATRCRRVSSGFPARSVRPSVVAPLLKRSCAVPRAPGRVTSLHATEEEAAALVGEDSADFKLEEQTVKAWATFFFLLTSVLGGLYLVWIQPGSGLAGDYVELVKSFTDGNTEATMTAILGIFAVAHSGLAGLRSKGEDVVGERAYRVIFALVSLSLAIVALVYFINHRYSGTPLWNVRGTPFLHELLWVINFISFLFLYPSTFNILEVAAVDKPKVHLWETGIIRITRHPQMVGQGLWCLAHTIWIGNSFMVVTSLGLMAHHLFGCWHGDRRLYAKYGEAFEEVKAQTSTVPFAAILDGRQKLPDDYYKEFLRVPYAAVVAFTIGAYLCHPLFQAGSYYLGW